MSEKTEQPTPQRLEQARKKGQVARSRLFSASAVLAGGLFGLGSSWEQSTSLLLGWTRSLLSQPTADAPSQLLFQGVQLLTRMAVPPLGGAMLGAAAVSLLSVGFRFEPGLVAPKFERISPAAGFKRLFGAQQWIEAIKGLVLVIAFAALVFAAVKGSAAGWLRAAARGGAIPLSVELLELVSLLERCAVVLAVLGSVDFLWARRRHLMELRMTKQEVKQEHKNSEGDPQHKAKRRALHRQLAQGGPARGLKSATVLVVNPTHVAVALRFDETECAAPYLVAKGREADALELRRQAGLAGVPIIRNVPLARTLVQFELGEEIPEELYEAAAVVLRLVSERNQANSVAQGGRS